MDLLRTYEGWVVAHRMTGQEVVRIEDRDGQCKGGGKRVTFEAIDAETTKLYQVLCERCRTDQKVVGVNGPINVNII